jgi:hypothetical protein
VAVLCLGLCGWAQEKENQPPRRKGSITGRVVAADGQPLSNAQVNVAIVGVMTGAMRTFTTDDEGNFIADGLAAGSYTISAVAPAYISEAPAQKLYRLGESATITMYKGGVITGRVTNLKGEPLQSLSVQATRVRDDAGRKVTSDEARTALTDDRGIYRLYGLQAGAYVIAASGGAPSFVWGGPGSPYDESAPIYYPATTREAATEVKVQLGEEVQGIDLRHRLEKGHRISGTVVGLPLKSKTGEIAYSGASLSLTRVPGGGLEQSGSTYELQEQKGFVLHGVADGEYELQATASNWRNENADQYASPKRRVTIKGNDVTNVLLAMSPLASVAGQLVVETMPERAPSCPPSRAFARAETLLALPRANAEASARPRPLAPDDKNEFQFRALEAGQYFFTAQLPHETWYIKAIKLIPVSPSSKLRSPSPLDVGKQGLNIKAGDKVTGVTMTIADGAASVQGRVVAASDKPLPARLRVHLLPAEKDAADDVLRYGEVTAKADGQFVFAHLAPGNYWLLARVVSEDESDETPVLPTAWNASKRAQLRREAEAANQIIELKSCQRANDFVLRPPAAK